MRVVGTVRSERLNKDIPLYDIPMMTNREKIDEILEDASEEELAEIRIFI